MQEIKLAVIGNYATQFISKSLEKSFRKSKISALIYNADFNAIDFEIIDENSGLYQFKPEYIIWHESTLGLRDQFYHTSQYERKNFAQSYAEKLQSYLTRLKFLQPKTKILYPSHGMLFNDYVYGNYASKVEKSWSFQITKLNALINEIALENSNFYPIDSLNESLFGDHINYTQVINAELHYTPTYLDWLANTLANFIFSISGKFKKCIILDLDNTLWGGVIGDDGLEGIQIGNLGIGKAFTRFQKWLKELKNRGIILAVCSKNNQEIAQQPFIKHSEMVLSLDDIAIFIANWNSKADNINTIREILNIGFDSMVFIDDNPAEREIVRKHLPDIEVPELPEDPAEYLPYLISLNIFETSSFSEYDSERTEQYRLEAQRVELSKSITNMDEFLTSLKMTAEIRRFSKNDIERVAQLTQRSNQFNLRTVRYTAGEISDMLDDERYFTFCLEMKDKFGSYGIVSVVIIRKIEKSRAFIDSWIMSCRVLKRTVESFMMNNIIKVLEKNGVEKLCGEFIPTPKNKLVQQLLDDLGMQNLGDGKYELCINKFRVLKTFIING